MVGCTFSFLLSALSLLIPFLSMLFQSLFIAFFQACHCLSTAFLCFFVASLFSLLSLLSLVSLLFCSPCFAALLAFRAFPALCAFPAVLATHLSARRDRVHCTSHRSETSKRIEFYLPPPCWTEIFLLQIFFGNSGRLRWKFRPFEVMPGREDQNRTEKEKKKRKNT